MRLGILLALEPSRSLKRFAGGAGGYLSRMSEPEDIEVEKTMTEFRIEFDLEGHKIEVEGHQGLAANQYRLYLDGTKVDEIDKSMGTHHLRAELPGVEGAAPRPLAIALEGSARNKTYLEFEGEKTELLKSWVA